MAAETCSIGDVGLSVPKFEINPDCAVAVDGYEVFQWPEFQALAFRLGIDLTRPVKRLVLDLGEGYCPVVLVEQRGSDAVKAAQRRIETTVVQNERYRTFLTPDEPEVVCAPARDQ